jgi:DeoR family transcriptional regulator of aga operon
MNKVQERRQAICDLLSTVESISVETLAERLQVTGATIRSDLRDMESRREIYRSHGQVSLVRPHITDLDIREKIFINAEQKNRIGAAAAAMIGKNDAILMTSGSTIDAMARQVEAKESLHVVTPSVGVALALSQKPGVEVMILGGTLVRKSLSVRDNYTIEGLKHVSCTKLFLSCDGLDLHSGVITAFIEEARLTRAMMGAAGKVILLADSSKIGKTGYGKICDLRDVDILITDDGIPDAVRRKFEAAGVSVVTA